MRSVPNTLRRGAVFHFRRAVPEDLRDHFKRAELTCSLRTVDVGVARRLSRALYVCTERRVSHAMLRAGIDVAEALKARAEGDFQLRA